MIQQVALHGCVLFGVACGDDVVQALLRQVGLVAAQLFPQLHDLWWRPCHLLQSPATPQLCYLLWLHGLVWGVDSEGPWYIMSVLQTSMYVDPKRLLSLPGWEPAPISVPGFSLRSDL